VSDYNTPIRTLQQGSVLQIASGGTISVSAGGSIQNAGGMSAANVTATGTVSAGMLVIGGTVGKWAYGTATMTAGGSVFVNTGLTTVVSAAANTLAARAAVNAAGGTYVVQVDPARFANGSITLLSVAGGTVTPGGGNVTWMALGE
jgi:hypothetical protein